MTTLKVNAFQQYMSPTDWVNLLGKPLEENAITNQDWELVSYVVDHYIEQGKPSNFNFMACLNAFKSNFERDRERDLTNFVPLYVQTDDGSEVENYEIYKAQDNSKDAFMDNMCLDSAFAELETINREIMIKHQVNLIKLLRRCVAYPNEYSEEFMTLKAIIKELDEDQQEQIMIVLSSGLGITA